MKADQGCQDSTGKTVLHIAADLTLNASNEKIIRLLINHHADMNLKDNYGRTALDYAREKGNADVENWAKWIAEKRLGDGNPLPCEGKVDYYVKSWREMYGINLDGCQMDDQAAWSVTVAKLRDEEILINRHSMPRNLTILDGMACVGGDSLSFMHHFTDGLVISNELDPLRHRFLVHNLDNVRKQLGKRGSDQRYRLGSVLDIWEWEAGEGANYLTDVALFRQCDAIYLDPEWGGVEYREAGSSLHIQIGEKSLDSCVTDALNASQKLRWVVLKLPRNFDREMVSRVLVSDSSPRRDPGYDVGVSHDRYTLSVHSYKILQVVRGAVKEKMIFVVIERVQGGHQSPNAAYCVDQWRHSRPEELRLGGRT